MTRRRRWTTNALNGIGHPLYLPQMCPGRVPQKKPLRIFSTTPLLPVSNLSKSKFYFFPLVISNTVVHRHILNCLVQNEPGVLSRVSGILAGRGFNIDSLVVCRTEIRDLSRMCIVLSGQDGVVEQARRQLEDLVRRMLICETVL